MTGKLCFFSTKNTATQIAEGNQPLIHTEQVLKIPILSITKCHDGKARYLGAFQSRNKCIAYLWKPENANHTAVPASSRSRLILN